MNTMVSVPVPKLAGNLRTSERAAICLLASTTRLRHDENVRLRCPAQLMRSGLRRQITNLSNIGDGRGQLVRQVHHDIMPAA